MKQNKLKLPKPVPEYGSSGRPDFFDDRHKDLTIELAQFKLSDIFYDLGCGNAALLIYVVNKCKLKKAVGFENKRKIREKALQNVKKAGLQDIITIKKDYYDADVTEADVIFQMLPEDPDDLSKLFSKNKKFNRGTRLIKHDLPLIGYLPKRVRIPFYLMEFPLQKARNKNQWASAVLQRPNATPHDVWKELYYYSYEKTYPRSYIEDFDSMLSSRVG